jgi:prepilin-type processing-associated H-X9-DG protein/prepilin-type N-terminal cleavage/methylation domain-containing protein
MRKFTLIELLIVIAIIGILISLLLPSLGKARNRALDAVCLSNQKQIGILMSVYTVGNYGLLPNHRKGNKSWIEFIDPSLNENLYKCPRIDSWSYSDGSRCIPDVSSVVSRVHKVTYGYNGWWLGLYEYNKGASGQPMNKNYMFQSEAASPANLLVTSDSRPIKSGNSFKWGSSVWYPFRRSSNPDKMEGAYATHGNKKSMTNVLFLDGHVKPEKAFPLNYDSAKSTMWNPDIDRWPTAYD